MVTNEPYRQAGQGEPGGSLTLLQSLYLKMHYLINKYIDNKITRKELETKMMLIENNLFKERVKIEKI